MPSAPGFKRLTAAPVLLTLASVFWAGNAIVARASIHDITPFTLNFWRWAVALMLLAPFTLAHVRRDVPIIAAHAPLLGLLGLLSVSIYSATVYLAAQTAEAITLSVIGAATPVASVIAAGFIIREPVSRREVIGFLIALAGLLPVISRGDLSVLLGLQFGVGEMFMLFGVATWGVYSALIKRCPAQLHPLSLVTVVVASGLVGVVPFYVWEVAQGVPLVPTTGGGLAILYGAVFPSVLTYIFFLRGVAEIGPNRANLYSYLAPLFAGLFAVVLLGESLAFYHFAGLGLIFFGVYYATRPFGGGRGSGA